MPDETVSLSDVIIHSGIMLMLIVVGSMVGTAILDGLQVGKRSYLLVPLIIGLPVFYVLIWEILLMARIGWWLIREDRSTGQAILLRVVSAGIVMTVSYLYMTYAVVVKRILH